MKCRRWFTLAWILAIGMSTALFSQKQQLSFHAAIGLTPTFLKDKSQMKVPPLALETQLRLSSNFSLGLYGGYSLSTGFGKLTAGSGIYKFTNAFRMLALRCIIHSKLRSKIEFLGGMSIGLAHSDIQREALTNTRIATQINLQEWPSQQNGLLVSAFLGIKYFPTKHWGTQLELGLGVALISWGIICRI